LIETLQRREPLVRERAAKLLGDMKVQRAVGPLLAVLGRADVKQAWGTASALGDMKVKTAVGPLIELLEWDDSRTRARGAGALAYIGDARAIGPLSKLAVRDGGNDVAEAAVGALTQIPNGGMEAAIALLRHKNSRTRESAARSLAYVHDPRLIEPLLQAIRDPAIQDTAAQSLHWIVKYRGIDVALDAFAMKDVHQEVRRVALVEISRSDHPKKVELLIEGLADPGDEVQGWAVRALAKVKPREAVESLIVVLKTAKNNGVRADAAEALGEIGDPKAFDALTEAVGDKTSLARAAAAKALGKLGDPGAIPSLLGLLDNEGFDSRRYAAYALARFEDPRVAPALIGLLKHPSATTRTDAAWALGKVKAPGVVEALVTASNDEDSYVRNAATSSLARLDDPKTDAAVRATLDPPSAQRVLDSIHKKREAQGHD
jgi:HEAT repeat protein